MTPKEWANLLRKVVEEAQNGVSLWIDLLVVVGREANE